MIVAGFGCRSTASEEALRAALALHSKVRLTALATLTHKEPLVAPLAHALGLPLILIDPRAIERVATMTVSQASLSAYRTGSVAEAVALVATGPGARVLARRAVSPDGQATCAIAHGVPA